MAAQIKDAHPSGDALHKKAPQITTALVSVVGTVLVAFIGVLPQLRNKDVIIDELQGQVARLTLQTNPVGAPNGKAPAATDKRLLISGTVLDLKGRHPLSATDVYLIPLSNPKLMATTDETGGFKFKDIPDQRYWIVVRDSGSGSSSAGFIDEDNSEARFKGAVIKYRVEK